MSVCILTLNPCIDVEWRVSGVRWEEKNTIESERRWAGGKGVNVARWLRFLGGTPQLLLPLGGATGRELATHLRREGLRPRIVPLREPTRVNTLITTATGRQLRFNQTGPQLSAAEWRALREYFSPRHPNGDFLITAGSGLGRQECRPPSQVLPRRPNGPRTLLILSGALPRGLPVDTYAQLTRLAHRLGAMTLLDCDGPAFAAAVDARPFLVKPNTHELALWHGSPLRSARAIRDAALRLSEATRGWVLVSRGAAGGMLANAREGFFATQPAPQASPLNTLGAGDALLAAVARQIELHSEPSDWLREGVRIGSAATQCRAGGLPD